MVDGNLGRAVRASAQADGSWSAELPLSHLLNGRHRLMAYSPAQGAEAAVFSRAEEFELALPERLAGMVEDELGDDRGRAHDYVHPTFPTFEHQMDIVSVGALVLGTNLQLELEMSQVRRYWMPPNGFDHALINIYLDVPSKTGMRALPLLNAEFPDGGHWDYRISTSSHANAMYTSDGVLEEEMGVAVRPSPRVESEDSIIRFTITAKSLGYPETLTGTRVYVTTWTGTPSAPARIKPVAENWVVGGKDESSAKIFDDIEVLILD